MNFPPPWWTADPPGQVTVTLRTEYPKGRGRGRQSGDNEIPNTLAGPRKRAGRTRAEAELQTEPGAGARSILPANARFHLSRGKGGLTGSGSGICP